MNFIDRKKGLSHKLQVKKSLLSINCVEHAPELTPQNDKRMTIKMSPELNQHLEWIAKEQSVSLVEAIRKAIALESYLRQALKRKGARLLIQDDDGVRELLIR